MHVILSNISIVTIELFEHARDLPLTFPFILLINKQEHSKKISLKCNINLRNLFSALLYAHCDLCGLLLDFRRVCFPF